ncbi:hypothetical protein VOLCADRAFT_101123 [Volvox carteri f. nagariensis]|uniref:Uncharacterized protein n=1 Tax=Volvox carteri f. nagariensis TaxID=3068 RepID=D8ULT5_VOLCA|nr:uncharacterized protein VOLCADRAFT_101123 [Volvox carteri f. nagariensis]EFJ39315.1 hypothetical protein VOLCADRAFT_101123 [Volvox carteri f. nagariensis]|eukprot:XP_002959621.1 hypothetical protein VOLCADRAFT_101123 [Volvox carteri f. nagariensis]
MAPKMARQSQASPQTLAPVNLGAYGTPSTSQPSTSSAGAQAKPPVDIADLWAQLAAASPTGGGRDRSSPAGVPKRPLSFNRMKDDARRYQPFRNHFTLTRLMSTANPALAHKMEAFYIAQFKARGPGGYNVLHGPPSASPAFYAMTQQRAGGAHTPTAVTVQDDDAPATLA